MKLALFLTDFVLLICASGSFFISALLDTSDTTPRRQLWFFRILCILFLGCIPVAHHYL